MKTSTAVAVMFTFSFSSAFAYNPQTTVADKTAAMAKITDKYNDELAKLDSALAVAKAGTKTPANATAADFAAACQEAYDSVKADLDVQLAKAYQAFGAAEQVAATFEGGIQGYDYESSAVTPTDGYVYYADALAKINPEHKVGCSKQSIHRYYCNFCRIQDCISEDFRSCKEL